MSMPHVCVLICTYNYSRFLKQAIDSALAQTYKNISICIIDDGSTDNTIETLEEYVPYCGDGFIDELWDCSTTVSRDGKIHGRDGDVPFRIMLKNTNTGPSDSRNIGIRATIDNVDAYVIADADDIMCPEKVEKLVKVWNGQENGGIVYADYQTLNEQGHRTREYKPVYSWEHLKKECIIHSASLVSKLAMESVKEDNDYYCTKLRTCEDYDLWLRICQTKMACHLAENLTTVRTHSQDSTHTVKSEVWNSNYALVMQRLNQRQNGGPPHV